MWGTPGIRPKAALDHAGQEGYLSHEFGDAMVVI
jgi:hypothetical protein